MVQGGSTITQQLVGLTLGRGRTASTGASRARSRSSPWRSASSSSTGRSSIFELYLNQVYMGNGVYGIGTAAKFYFRKPARELTLAEGATLAGLIRQPDYYEPIDHPEVTRLRRDDVLKRMEALGWISEERLADVRELPLRLPEDAGKLARRHPPFFVKYLIDQIDRERVGRVHPAREDPEGAPPDAVSRAASRSTPPSSPTGSRGPRKRHGGRCGSRSVRRPARRLPTSRSSRSTTGRAR